MSGAGGIDSGSTLTSQTLRCSSCGAPYSDAARGDILTCGYCGTTQRTVDARQFLDHFTAQVTAFLRQAVPPGLDVSRSATVDPVARLAAFNGGVRPHLATESDQYRFALFNLLSGPLVVLPFLESSIAAGAASPTAASVFVAKVQSVSGLAVDDSGRELVRRATATASAYQCLLVAGDLVRGARPERFHLVAQNLATASGVLAEVARWKSVATRLSALAAQARAADRLLAPDGLPDVRRELAAAQDGLARAQEALAAEPELGYMASPVGQELGAVRALGAMARLVESSPRVPPHPYAYLERLGRLLDHLAHDAPGDWAATFRALRLREGVLVAAAALRAAQGGQGTVRALTAEGGPLLPYWVVELPYTFETGVLWTKRGKETPETLLVAATFPADRASLDGAGSTRAVTNVFATGPGGAPLSQAYSRWTGREQKLSDSGGLGPILGRAAETPIAGRPAVPPLTTEAEALRLMNSYLQAVRAANPKISAQLRSSSPRVIGLVYAPTVLNGPVPLPWLGRLSPASVGDPQVLGALAA